MPTDPKALVDLLMYMERHFSILPQEINGQSLAFFMLHRFVHREVRKVGTAMKRRLYCARDTTAANVHASSLIRCCGNVDKRCKFAAQNKGGGYGPRSSSEDWCSFRTNT
jgi:hypothetical protein